MLIRTCCAAVRAFARSRFAGNVAIMCAGAAAAQLIGVVFSPVLTRIYGPEAFGVLGVFTAIVSFLAPAPTLTYGLAVVLPSSDSDAHALVKLSVLVAVVACGVLSAVVGFLGDYLARCFGFALDSAYLLLVPVVVLFTGVEEALRHWLVRKRQFRRTTAVSLAHSTVTTAAMVAAGTVAATGHVLVAVSAAGHALCAVLLWAAAGCSRWFPCLPRRSNLGGGGPESLPAMASSYRDFPLCRAPQVALNAASQNLAPLLLAAFLGPAAAGFYTLSRRVLALPSMLVSQAVGVALLPDMAARAHRGERLKPQLVRATLGLAAVGLLPFGLVMAAGPRLFAAVFGPDWGVAGEYARWMSVWLYFHFINAPSLQAVPVLGLQSGLLAFEAFTVIARVAALLYGAAVAGSPLAAVALFSVAGALSCVAVVCWVIRRSSGASRFGGARS